MGKKFIKNKINKRNNITKLREYKLCPESQIGNVLISYSIIDKPQE